jgi:hypothetical protein
MSRSFPRWAVPALLALTFVVRMAVTSSARFGGDETIYWITSRSVAGFHELPKLGPEVSGSAARLPGPGLYLVGAPPWFFFDSPYAGAVWVALLHTLGAFMIHRLARQARGERAGLLALLIVAIAPWDVLYGDRFWPSCITPIVATIALFCAATAREAPWRIGPAMFVAIFLPQLHLSAPTLWAAMVAVVLLRPPAKIPWAAAAIGIVLGCVSYTPYLMTEIPSGFANTKLLFTHAQGAVPGGTAWTLPLKVLLSAVLYGSSEIGYHFARGYWAWAGGFDEVVAYLTPKGWAASAARLGIPLLLLVAASMLFSLYAWIIGLVRAARPVLARRRSIPELEPALTAALAFGFLAAATLLFLSKKPYFPHYANVLLPTALWPIVMALDHLFDHAKARIAGAAIVAITLVGSGWSLYRYYAEIDSLNGIATLLSIAERIGDDPAKVKVQFDHLPNEFALTQIAAIAVKKPIDYSPHAKVTYTVHNRSAWTGELPPGGTIHGQVMVQRSPPTGDGFPDSLARDQWKTIKVAAICDDGTRTECVLEGAYCRYGKEPWQHFGPEPLAIGGSPVPILFMHPILNCTIRAEIPAPIAGKGGTLRFGLSDAAHDTGIKVPVDVVLSRAGTEYGRAPTPDKKGFAVLAFPAGEEPLVLEIRTANDGARVFGFDLDSPK